MHGVVHAEFRQYAMARVGHEEWKRLLGEAGLPLDAPRLARRYPDEDIVAAVGALAHATGEPVEEILFDFGRALFPGLVAAYGTLIPSNWRTLDLVENTETVIHRTIRLQDRTAAPPRLGGRRTGEHEVRVTYRSERRLCDLARGLLIGAAAHYDEAVEVREPRCTRRGDPVCEFVVSLTPADREGPVEV